MGEEVPYVWSLAINICNGDSNLLSMEENSEVSDGQLRIRLEPGEVLTALGDHHGVALGWGSPTFDVSDFDEAGASRA